MRVRDRLYAALDREPLHRLAGWVPPLRALARRLATAPDGSHVLTSGPVHWEGYDFAFTAPMRVHRMAAQRGIENIISRFVRVGVPEGGTVVDVGGNYGFITMVAARRVGPTGTVLTFEPDPAIVPVLTGTLASNGVTDRVRLVTTPAGAPGGSATTVDEQVGDRGPVHLVKIDVDGDDLGVLLGAEHTVERDHPVLIVELTQDHEEIVAWLRARYAVVLGQEGEVLDGSPWPQNVVALPERAAWLDDVWLAPGTVVSIPDRG